MDEIDLALPLDELIATVMKYRHDIWALEVPEGIKRKAVELVPLLEKATSSTFVVSADPCFGACDLSGPELKRFGVEAVLHLGHLPLGDLRSVGVDYFFIPLGVEMDYGKVCRDAMPDILDMAGKLGVSRVGVVTTAQHTLAVETVKEVLTENGLNALVGTGGPRIFAPGQVLGCEFSCATSVARDVDGFIFVGTGKFHPIGVSMTTDLPVITLDPYSGAVGDVEEERERTLRVRYGAVSRARDATKFGIVGSTRPGQVRRALTFSIKKKLGSKGYTAVVLAGKHLDPGTLDHLGLEALVITACPRIAMDDQAMYALPILTPADLEMLLGERGPEGYRFDQFTRSEWNLPQE